MKLYDAGLSPNALRVRAVADELGLPLQLVEVNLGDPAARVAAIGGLNPNGKVPVLVDGDLVLWESRAIIAYLAALRPEAGLYPDPPRQRAVIDQWSYWQAAHLNPIVQRITYERLFRPAFGRGAPDEAAIAEPLREVAHLCRILDRALQDRPFITGALSLADFTLASTFAYRVPTGLSLAATPALAGWLARVEARPSWQLAAEPIRAFLAGIAFNRH